jgi:DNA primase (bacterial type)
MLTYKEANKISIKDYLKNILNIIPVKDRGYYGMYHSPFRQDNDASLKVDYNKNLWIDFGNNKGGTLIDLIMQIDRCSEKQALDTINQYVNTTVNQYDNTTGQINRRHNVGTHQHTNVPTESFSFHGEPVISITDIKELTNPALLDYIKERCINADIAKKHCKEVHYRVNDKPYFALGFENNSKGYELRNKYFQGCTSKDYTIKKRNSNICLVFEGFMDYLSYLTIKNIHSPKQDIIILNSVTNLPKAIDLLKGYKEIHTYLDNDEAGKKATLAITQTYPNTVDHSTNYATNKDLNDYLISTKQIEQKVKPAIEVKRKPSRGFRR